MTRDIRQEASRRSRSRRGPVARGRLSQREHGLVVVAILLVTALFNGAYTAFAAINGHPPSADQFASELGIHVLTCLLAYGMFWIVARTFGRPTSWRVLAAAGATLLAVLGWAIGVIEIRLWLGNLPYRPEPVFILASAIWGSPIFVIWALALLALGYGLDSRERGYLLTRANELAQSAQLEALRYQINPHFLYNTLNSISTLILDGRHQQADEMVMRLSTFLRSSLTDDATEDVTLAEEIALQSAYLDIEKVRFADQLRVRIDIPSAVERALVPGFILQPLIENVIKHGLGPVGSMTELELVATRNGDRLAIEVRNRGPLVSRGSASTGVGLQNVRQRLATRFGAQQSFVAGPQPDGFSVRLELPFRPAARPEPRPTRA